MSATMAEAEASVRSVRGSCLCETCAYEISLPSKIIPLPAYICHCDSCRHMTGTLCLTVAFAPKGHPLDEPILEQLQPYHFSPRVTFYFCPSCGTQMLARVLSEPEDPACLPMWGFLTGAIDEIEGLVKFQVHEQVQDTLDGGFADFLPSISGELLARWPGHPGVGEQLPLPWRADQPAPAIDHNSTEPLTAYCRCHTLTFHISRPTPASARARALWPDTLVPYHSKPQSSMPSETENWWLRGANRDQYYAGTCVCRTCRVAAGVEVVEFAFIPAVNLWRDRECTQPLIFGEMAGIKSFASSKGVKRFFCGSCGALAFWDGELRSEVKDVGVGLLAAPEGARAEKWLEWGTERVSFAEVGMQRAPEFVRSLEVGLMGYGKRKALEDELT